MRPLALFVLLALALALVSVDARHCRRRSRRFRVFRDTSRDANGLRRIVDKFNRALGGDDNGNAPGPLNEGRRSINWDAAVVPFDMPGDFFARVVTRGATMVARRGEFRVSNPDPNPQGDDRFSSINRKASKDFITFSPKRLFTPLKDNKVTVVFSIPAKRQLAAVKGFGAVYVDVDHRRVTSATYLDRCGCVLAKQFVDPRDRGLSFLGLIFKKPVIAKVVLKLGSAPISRRFGDFVVLDDFLYSEPRARGVCRRRRRQSRRRLYH